MQRFKWERSENINIIGFAWVENLNVYIRSEIQISTGVNSHWLSVFFRKVVTIPEIRLVQPNCSVIPIVVFFFLMFHSLLSVLDETKNIFWAKAIIFHFLPWVIHWSIEADGQYGGFISQTAAHLSTKQIFLGPSCSKLTMSLVKVLLKV